MQENSKDRTSKKHKKKLPYFVRFLIKTAIIIAAAMIIIKFITPVKRMNGNNMFPAQKDGDLCVFYSLDGYYTGDVVLYEHEGEKRIGRIVAREGEEVDFPETGGYTIDGIAPSEEIAYQTFAEEDSEGKYPVQVSNGCVFIMNDFRSDTKDSRQFGSINLDDIKGKLIFQFRRRGF